MMEEKERETEEPFNMAIASLQRIDSVLQQISILDSQYSLDSAEKQKSAINLLKRFFIISSPLLFKLEKKSRKDKDEKGKEGNQKTHLEILREEILSLQIETKNIVKSGAQATRYVFNISKEKRINEILIELQVMLIPYMMPGKRDVEGLI